MFCDIIYVESNLNAMLLFNYTGATAVVDVVVIATIRLAPRVWQGKAALSLSFILI